MDIHTIALNLARLSSVNMEGLLDGALAKYVDGTMGERNILLSMNRVPKSIF